MAFPPPTHGHVETPMAETIDDYLRPKKSAIHAMLVESDLQIKCIHKGDALTIELGRNPHNGCVGLVEFEGETFLAVLHWHRGRWFVQTDDRRGAVTEAMTLIGVARALIKNQVN